MHCLCKNRVQDIVIVSGRLVVAAACRPLISRMSLISYV